MVNKTVWPMSGNRWMLREEAEKASNLAIKNTLKL